MTCNSKHSSAPEMTMWQFEQRLAAYIKQVQQQHSENLTSHYLTARLLKQLNQELNAAK